MNEPSDDESLEDNEVNFQEKGLYLIYEEINKNIDFHNIIDNNIKNEFVPNENINKIENMNIKSKINNLNSHIQFVFLTNKKENL